MRNSKQSENHIAAFQLTNSGELLSINQEDLIKHLISINILFIYSISKKHAFIWVGKNARRDLKGQIQTIEPRFIKENPQYTILRHFTIDEAQEPFEFFQALSIDKKELENSRDRWRSFRLDVYRQIDDLKILLNSNKMIGEVLKTEQQALEIINLAKQVHDDEIIQEYQRYLSEIEEKKELLLKQKEYLDKIPIELEQIQVELDQNQLEKANQRMLQIKEWYRTILTQAVPTDTQKILDIVKTTYKAYLEALEKIEVSKQSLKKCLEQDQFSEAHVKRQEIEILYSSNIKKEFTEELQKLFAEETKAYDAYLLKEKERLREEKEINEFSQKIEECLQEIHQLLPNHDYASIISNLETLSSSPTLIKMPEKKRDLDELIKKYNNEKSLRDNKSELFERLKTNIKDAQESKRWKVAIENTKKILEIGKELDKHEDIHIYTPLLQEFLQYHENELQTKATHQHELMAQANELKNIIEVSEDVLPLSTNISIDEILGDLSSDVDQMLDQIGTVLDSHRVEIKTEMTSKSTIQTASGEFIEFDQTTTIDMVGGVSSDSETKSPSILKFEVNSGLENKFNETIEEAIIEDLIPYNYEISEIILNGEEPESQPQQILTENGLSLQWTLTNIAPQEKVDIHYDLQRRVSRTIILPLDKELKIIKTHSNIRGMDKEGLFDAQLKFANQFHRTLDGLVIEDIIPSFYLYNVKKPEDQKISNECEETHGSLVKWNLTSIPEDHTMLHWYMLINMYYFEELKIKANKLAKDGMQILETGKILDSIQKFSELLDLLKTYQ